MEKAIVLHSDILGYKSLMEKAEKDNPDKVLQMFKNALKEPLATLELFQKVKENSTMLRFTHKIFSDNLYASFGYEDGNAQSFSDAFLACIFFSRSYFAVMLDNELLIRGGISFGNDYADESMIFSYALVKAYLLESKKAIYPRIIIDDELIAKISDNLIVPGKFTFKGLNNSILKDRNGVYFLNPMEMAEDLDIPLENYSPREASKGFTKRYIEFVRKRIEVIMEEKNSELLDKYIWLLELLEWILYDRQKLPTMTTFKPLNFKRKDVS